MAQKFKFVALQGVHFTDENDKQVLVTPKTNKGSGLFNAPFSAERARKLIDMGAIRLATVKDNSADTPVVLQPDEDDSADDLESLTVVKLKALAGERNIDLGDKTAKADIIAAIRAADPFS